MFAEWDQRLVEPERVVWPSGNPCLEISDINGAPIARMSISIDRPGVIDVELLVPGVTVFPLVPRPDGKFTWPDDGVH